ncbi:MAG: hypothetical protein WBN68_20490, partial [Sedimenticolaceae bacterium]
MPVCQDFFCQSSFYQQLFELDQAIAAAVRQAGCPYCSGRLHVADYPRKPRGLREPLTADYQRRLSSAAVLIGEQAQTAIPAPESSFTTISLTHWALGADPF